MKKFWERAFIFSAFSLLILGTGCASTKPFRQPPAGVTYHHDKDIQLVWLAPSFDFNGYDGLYVADTKVELNKALDPDSAKLILWAKEELRRDLTKHIATNGVFRIVTDDQTKIDPAAKTLTMDNIIIEYARGNGAARFWAGVYGAGQPVIRVQGTVTDGNKPVFVFESYRSGDSVASRLDSGFTPEQALQLLDIEDLGGDMANFIKDTSRHVSRK